MEEQELAAHGHGLGGHGVQNYTLYWQVHILMIASCLGCLTKELSHETHERLPRVHFVELICPVSSVMIRLW